MAGSYRIGWFSTGRGPGSYGLLQAVRGAIAAGEIDARIDFVYCTRERGETEATDRYLDLVESYGIPLVSYSYQKYRAGRPNPDLSQPLPEWRLNYDREVLKRLEPYAPDLCVLAGFMLVSGPEVCERFKIINLHPAAPAGPAGTWQQVIWKLIETDADTQGIKMHVAIPEMDAGPTATYCTFSIRGPVFDPLWRAIEGRTVAQVQAAEGEQNTLFKTIRAHGAVRETPLIVATIRAFSRSEVRITDDRQVVDAAGRVIPGYDLTPQIDAMVRDKLPQ
jgi:phosphoribosylglycinamide formyltransferase-1